MGLPCGHDLKLCVSADVPILLESVHRHWWFNPTEAPPQFSSSAARVLDPIRPSAASQPQGTSTRREASQWERVNDILDKEQSAACQNIGRKRKHFEQDDTSGVSEASQDQAATEGRELGKYMSDRY